MPKRTKRRASHASSRMHRTPKVKTYPRLAIISVVLLTMVGLGYVWVYYNKINVRTPEIMRQDCPQRNECIDNCIATYGRGTSEVKACRAGCPTCSTTNNGGGVSYSCDQSDYCKVGESKNCENNKPATGQSQKTVCEPNPSGCNLSNKEQCGCWVTVTYNQTGCMGSNDLGGGYKKAEDTCDKICKSEGYNSVWVTGACATQDLNGVCNTSNQRTYCTTVKTAKSGNLECCCNDRSYWCDKSGIPVGLCSCCK